LDINKCGAPCIGLQSTETYSSISSEVANAIENDARIVHGKLHERMRDLSLLERFEDAALVRNRAGAFAKGAARSQRIRSLTEIKEFIAARKNGNEWEIFLIQSGRLITSLVTKSSPGGLIEEIRKRSEKLTPSDKSLPASTHEEVELILRFLYNNQIEILFTSEPWQSPVFGGEYLRSKLDENRFKSESLGYKEDFANSFELSRRK
jgi:DNA polymerase-3 subunit epsilon